MKANIIGIAILVVVETAYLIICGVLLPGDFAKLVCMGFSVIEAAMLGLVLSGGSIYEMGFHMYGRPAIAGICYTLQLVIGAVAAMLFSQNITLNIVIGIVLIAVSIVGSLAVASAANYENNIDADLRKSAEVSGFLKDWQYQYMSVTYGGEIHGGIQV